MTLAEVIVSIGLLGMVGTFVTTTAIVTVKTVDQTQTKVEDSGRGDLALISVSRVLRTAVLPEQLEDTTCTVTTNGQQSKCGASAITAASNKQVRFFANYDNTAPGASGTPTNKPGPDLVTFCVTGTPDRGCASLVTNPADARRGVLVQDTEAAVAVGANSYTYCSLTKTTGCPIKTRVVGRDLLVETSGFSYYDYDGKSMAASTLTGDGLRRVSSIDVKVVVSVKPGNPSYRHTSLTRVRLPNVEINLVGTT